MENQRNQFGEHPWQPLDFRRLSEYQASPRSVGAAEQADPGDARLISQSAFLIGSLELDDLDSDRDVARQQAMLTATSGSSQQSLRDTFMTGVSGSSDPPSSSGSMRPLVGQFQTSARGSDTNLDALPSFDTLLRHVADLRERNEQLGSDRCAMDLRCNRSLPVELSQYRKVISSQQKLREFMPAWGYDAVDDDATLVLVLLGRQIVRLPPERLRVMQTEEFLSLMKKYRRMLEDCCNTAQPDIEEKAHQDLTAGSGAQGLIDEVTALTLAIATTNPALLKAASNNDTDWSSIVEMLNIKEEQRKQLATMHHLFCCATQQLGNEREALLMSALDGESVSGSTGAASRGLEACSTATLALREQRMLEIAEKLQKLVGRQNRNLRLLADGALRQVLSPIQAALFYIYSAPQVPDVLALIQALNASQVPVKQRSSGDSDRSQQERVPKSRVKQT